jgi:hypothetical protein
MGLQIGVTKWLWSTDTPFVIYHRHAHHQLNTKHFNVARIKLVRLIKAGLTSVQRKLGVLGKQLRTTARRFHRRVRQVFQQGV